jgi:hypothetical protein
LALPRRLRYRRQVTWSDLIFVLPLQVLILVMGAVLLARRNRRERQWLWTSLLIHQVCALAIIVVTEKYYGGGDMMAYHRMGKFLAARLRGDFLGFAPDLFAVVLQRDQALPVPGTMVGSNTGSIQALSGFLMLVFQDSLPITCAAIAAAGFWAKVAVYDVLKRQLPDVDSIPLLIGCLLVPSAIFWSSGLLKEPIALVGLGLLIYGIDAAMGGRLGFKSMAAAGIGLVTVGLFKGYLLPPFGLGAGMWAFARAIRRGEGTVKTRYLVLAVVVAMTAMLGTGAWLPQFAPETFEDEARIAQEIGARIQGGSNYTLAAGGSFWAQIPLGLATTLLRPFIFETASPVLFFNGLEMAVISGMVVIGLFRRSLGATIRYVLSEPALAFCLGFVLTLGVGIGITSTNLGTLSRYRMPLLPFYVSLAGVLAARPRQLLAPALQAVPSTPLLNAQPRL